MAKKPRISLIIQVLISIYWYKFKCNDPFMIQLCNDLTSYNVMWYSISIIYRKRTDSVD